MATWDAWKHILLLNCFPGTWERDYFSIKIGQRKPQWRPGAWGLGEDSASASPQISGCGGQGGALRFGIGISWNQWHKTKNIEKTRISRGEPFGWGGRRGQFWHITHLNSDIASWLKPLMYHWHPGPELTTGRHRCWKAVQNHLHCT